MSKAILLLSLLQCLFCLNSGQILPPTMPETFEGTGEAELHGPEATTFGKFVIARDEAAQKGYEREVYDSNPPQVTESVLRYDINKTYYVRGDESRPHCIEEERNFNGMTMFWGWLGFAKYEGTTQIREIDYDYWGTNVGGVRFEFGKPRTNSSIVYFYRRKTTETAVFYSFMEFKSMPDPSLFVVPPECTGKEK